MKRCNVKEVLTKVFVTCGAVWMGCTPLSAYAQAGEEVAEETEQILLEEIDVDYEEEAENFGPLTPDGNLTLVDDYGAPEGGGKQFITVVTKSGNYFYIIIDRDDEGDETVHFLNMVDESDLLALMDDEEAKAYVESVTEEKPADENIATPGAVSGGDVLPTDGDGKDTPAKKGINPSKAVLPIALFGLLGGGAYFVFGNKGKNKKTKGKAADPDADYSEDEDDYLSGLDEEEEMEDEEISEDFDSEESEEE